MFSVLVIGMLHSGITDYSSCSIECADEATRRNTPITHGHDIETKLTPGVYQSLLSTYHAF